MRDGGRCALRGLATRRRVRSNGAADRRADHYVASEAAHVVQAAHGGLHGRRPQRSPAMSPAGAVVQLQRRRSARMARRSSAATTGPHPVGRRPPAGRVRRFVAPMPAAMGQPVARAERRTRVGLMSSSSPHEFLGMGVEEVLGHILAAVVVVDRGSRRIVYANPRARQMTAQLGRSIPLDLTEDWEIFHHDGRPYDVDEWPLVRSLTTGEAVVDEEYFKLRADGRRLFVRASSAPIFGDPGAIVGGVLVMTDVTERKAEAERLTYLAGLLDNTEDAIVALDAEWFIRVWNTGAERMYGWTADEVLGRHTLDVARLEMTYEERAEVRSTVAEHGRWRGEVVAYRKDGTPVCVEFITVALRGEQGGITGYLGIHRDVRGRKRAEEALREARRLGEAILESISDEFFALDRDWRYTFVNDRGLAEMGRIRGRKLGAADLLGRTVWEVFPELVGTSFDHEAHRALREQAVVQFETRSPVTGRWMDVRLYPSNAGLSIYVHDITERKRAEEELRRRAEQQALVAELGRRALASDDLQWVLEEAVGLLVRTLGVELACVAELPADRDEVILRAGVVGGRATSGGASST